MIFDIRLGNKCFNFEDIKQTLHMPNTSPGRDGGRLERRRPGRQLSRERCPGWANVYLWYKLDKQGGGSHFGGQWIAAIYGQLFFLSHPSKNYISASSQQLSIHTAYTIKKPLNHSVYDSAIHYTAMFSAHRNSNKKYFLFSLFCATPCATYDNSEITIYNICFLY